MTKTEKELTLKNARLKTKVAKLEGDKIMLYSELLRAEEERDRAKELSRMHAVRHALRRPNRQ